HQFSRSRQGSHRLVKTLEREGICVGRAEVQMWTEDGNAKRGDMSPLVAKFPQSEASREDVAGHLRRAINPQLDHPGPQGRPVKPQLRRCPPGTTDDPIRVVEDMEDVR